MAKEKEIFPVGTNVLAEDYDHDNLICGIVTDIKSKRYEMPYVVTWCDGDQLTYTFDHILEMNNDYKTKMGLW